KDKEPPWLVRLNVMENPYGSADLIPERFTITAGDWVELYAELPERPTNRERPYKVEVEVQGGAVEKIAAVRPARFSFWQGEEHLLMMPFANNQNGASERHHFLRGKSAGKATIKTAVSRGGTWKEVRQFDVTVAEQRRIPQASPTNPGFQ